ncbi:tetratricopeptide repeat protein [Chitinolyticbacter albus]|uniref:tetratricopeptide repeat protein n=1 Tax=Chitinolyticbacter albus TaxID=2961951 RepID=UPI00210A6D0C|nr:hypothetical protein [Chitinolyticbacter albus]
MSRALDNLRLEPLAAPGDAKPGESATEAATSPLAAPAPGKPALSNTPHPLTPRSGRSNRLGLLLTGLLGLLAGVGITLQLSPTPFQPMPPRLAAIPQPTRVPTQRPATAPTAQPATVSTPTVIPPLPQPALPHPDNPPRLQPGQSLLTGGIAPEAAVTISRGQASATAPAPLLAAWQAQRDGRSAEAEALYRQALARDARNLDALNGLAAVMQDRGDATAATSLYRRVLALQPGNAYAIAALAQLQGESDVDEATQRQRAQHAAPHAYALANRLAAAGRWREAQAYYFEACSRDPDEPDYVYNLAVSLDMLGQSGPATVYYRRALELAGQRSGRFDAATVKARLTELAGAAP